MGCQPVLVELLTEKYGVDAERISLQTKIADLGLNSLTFIELIFDIEDAFDIKISMDQTPFETLGEAVALVDRLIEAKAV